MESSPITTADVGEVRDLVQEQLARTFYGTRFQMASDAEQRYLAAMASLGHPPYAKAEVTRAWGAENRGKPRRIATASSRRALSVRPGVARSTFPSHSSPSSLSNTTRSAVSMTDNRRGLRRQTRGAQRPLSVEEAAKPLGFSGMIGDLDWRKWKIAGGSAERVS